MSELYICTLSQVAEEEIGSLQMELEAGLQEIGETEAEKIQLTHQIRWLKDRQSTVQIVQLAYRLSLLGAMSINQFVLNKCFLLKSKYRLNESII